jgi:hypothetical protein
MKTILRCDDLDDEPVIWFCPIIIAVLAMLTTVGGVIFGLVAFFH